MTNKLPIVFVNRHGKKIRNNKETFYSLFEEKIESEKKSQNYLDELMVKKKIDEIFASPRFIYKVKVLILTNEGETKENIIAKVDNNLITLSNKKINIKEIKDIKIIT